MLAGCGGGKSAPPDAAPPPDAAVCAAPGDCPCFFGDDGLCAREPPPA